MAITIAQQNSNNAGGGTATITMSTIANGALLIVSSRNTLSGSTVSGITGGGATGSWTLAKKNTQLNIWNNEIWYGYNSGGGSASVVVTYSIGSGNTFVAWAGELAGAATSGDPRDGTNGANGNNGTSMNSGNITPTAGTEVFIINSGMFQATTSSVAGPSGWTSLTGGAPTTSSPASYKIISSASGSYNATYAIGYNNYAVSIVAFKAAGGGGATFIASKFIYLQAVNRASTY